MNGGVYRKRCMCVLIPTGFIGCIYYCVWSHQPVARETVIVITSYAIGALGITIQGMGLFIYPLCSVIC